MFFFRGRAYNLFFLYSARVGAYMQLSILLHLAFKPVKTGFGEIKPYKITIIKLHVFKLSYNAYYEKKKKQNIKLKR